MRALFHDDMVYHRLFGTQPRNPALYSIFWRKKPLFSVERRSDDCFYGLFRRAILHGERALRRVVIFSLRGAPPVRRAGRTGAIIAEQFTDFRPLNAFQIAFVAFGTIRLGKYSTVFGGRYSRCATGHAVVFADAACVVASTVLASFDAETDQQDYGYIKR
jgi:hypothetical protein